MSPTIFDSNIDQMKGVWKVAMKSKNDVRRITDTLTFLLQDARGTTPPIEPSTCDPPLVSDGMGGCKMGDPVVVIPTITCPSLADMATFISTATNAELLAKKVELDALQDQGNTQLCVTQFLTFVDQEIAIRGIIVTTPTTGTSSVNAFIEYLSAHAPKGSETSGCNIPSSGTVGRLPTSGIAITGFQLLGFGTCEGNIWQNTQIDIVLDFGDDVQDFVIDDTALGLDHKMLISVNNPYPTNPTFSCTPSSNPTGIGFCILDGHNFLLDKIGDIALSDSQVQDTFEFFDQARGDPRVQLAHVNLQNNFIKNI